MNTTTTTTTLPGTDRLTAARAAIVAFVTGGVIAALATLAITDDPQTAVPIAEPAAAAAELPLAGEAEASHGMVSADTAERQALADRVERRRTCQSSPVSADALERCVAAPTTTGAAGKAS